MPMLTDIIERRTTPETIEAALAGELISLRESRRVWSEIRTGHGLKGHPDISTPPSANLKLAGAKAPSWGLTLQHHVSALGGVKVNTCPWAGQCTKVCVLDNGNGGFDSVQRVRRARTDLFSVSPLVAMTLLGHSIRRAVARDGRILYRPNVNSDVEWENIAPTLFDLEGVTFYGYTKNTAVLLTDGWVRPTYRVSYSFNEHSEWSAVNPFLAAGGSAAVVTDRRKGDPIIQWHGDFRVVDADKTDEWMFEPGVIGDLSFKPRSTKQRDDMLRRRRSFVQRPYQTSGIAA